MSRLRCAAYARYSTDKQSPLSIEDQVRRCRDFAQRQDWQFLEKHTYADEALSGTSDDRTGLRCLLKAATSLPLPFDVILIDDTSRLSRDLGDSLHITKRWKFDGLRVVFVSQGIDSASEQFEVLLATHGIADSLYVKELAKKTHRGLEGRAAAKEGGGRGNRDRRTRQGRCGARRARQGARLPGAADRGPHPQHGRRPVPALVGPAGGSL